jgi:CRP-like cAMP-binding protein
MSLSAKQSAGPMVFAVHLWRPGNPHKRVRHQLLSDDERAALARISSIVRFGKGEQIYNQADVADAAFSIISGVVTAYRAHSDGSHIVSFFHSGDLFGLSEEGRYSNATKAATPVVAYKIPLSALRRILDNNPSLDVNVIVKLCEELREAQRHALLLVQRRATTRLAMFLDLQQHLQAVRGAPAHEIYLPMDRSSIAAYVGMTLSAVSRAFRSLISRKIITTRDRHHVKIIDKAAFNKLIDTATLDK